jgi:hypothetical protein
LPSATKPKLIASAELSGPSATAQAVAITPPLLWNVPVEESPPLRVWDTPVADAYGSDVVAAVAERASAAGPEPSMAVRARGRLQRKAACINMVSSRKQMQWLQMFV